VARATSDIGRFSIVPEWIIFHPDLSSNAVRLYAVIGRYIDLPKGSIPSRKTLAEKMGISVDTLDRAKHELIDAEALDVEERTIKGKQATNRYHLKHMEPKDAVVAPPPGRTDAAPPRGRTDAAQNEREENKPQKTSSSSADDDPKSNNLVAFYCDLITKMGGIVDKRAKGQTASVIKTLLSDGFTEAHLQMALADQVARNTHPSILGQHAQKASIGARPGTEAFAAESSGEPDDEVARSRRRFAADDEYDKTAVGIGDMNINPAKILEEIE
jgi:hypothetical protein